MSPTSMEGCIAEIYSRSSPHILPFMGDAFLSPAATDLRVLAIGINAYFHENTPPSPESFANAWKGGGTYRYQRAVFHEAAKLSSALVSSGSMFAGKTFDVARSLYGTNAIKVWLPASRGRFAADVDAAEFDRHLAQWHDELGVLREHNVLPHVVIVTSEVFWERAWQTFHPDHHGGALGVVKYTAAWEDAPHRVNRIEIDRGDGERHTMLLVRLRHPAARGEVGTAKWLLEKSAFRQITSL